MKFKKLVEGYIKQLTEDEDEMSFDEIKNDVRIALGNMEGRVNEGEVRKILSDLTSWGFWQGESMVSINMNMATEIIDQLKDYIEEAPDSFTEELYDKIYTYA